LILDHISTFGEVSAFAEAGEYGYFFDDQEYSRSGLLWKDESDIQGVAQKLEKILVLIDDIDGVFFTPETIKARDLGLCNFGGEGSVLWPMRYALSGRDKSPDPFMLASVLGKR